MWKCPNCGRIFEKTGQNHTCKTVPLADHFKGKELAKDLFDLLIERINREIGPSEIISIPCCVHLFVNYDYLAALPRKDRLEIRFVSRTKPEGGRVRQTVPSGQHSYTSAIDLKTPEDIDAKLIELLTEAYHLRD